ncbi:ATP-grasp domain-containing protein [Nesterenkonia xinjiangensis]|uniref:D-alanine-D-alanine ligase-like ATP-grasp enzyme n=1 Tax=Nesterenkonia xinjiangensis TaxID=225327 RepID=A0A7Z0GJC0_9MICC|nr:ATP-grasp domain-containing protein [Nesterenkonia xinjiangensis]NYJ77007.1 D-alanine-D-alanine ligase-like ATP-grasp enzyme [Nesterenkonia xinjiangensis]
MDRFPTDRLPRFDGPPQTYEDADTAEVLRQHVEERRNLGSILNARAAEAAGAAVSWFGRKTAVAELDGRQVLLGGYICDQAWVGSKIAADKWLTKEFLRGAGVPAPAARRCASVAEALEFEREVGGGIVVKPLAGMGGKGVSVNLRGRHEVTEAFERALRVDVGGGVIAEEHIEGDREYRVLATQDRCISVVQRLLPHVTGDGVSTIRELITAKNALRRRNPALINRYIPLDAVTERHLACQGLALNAVLEAGRREVVRDVGGLSSGGEPAERLDDVEDAVKEAAVAAAAAVPGLTWSGSDILVEKGTGRPWVIEINSTPDLLGSTYPLYGTPRDVAEQTWKIRLAGTRPKPTGQAELPASRRADSDMSLYVGDRSGGHRTTRLSRLVSSMLESWGWRIRPCSQDVLAVEDPEGGVAWFTRNFLGVSDTIAPRQLIGRSGTTRRLLGASGVPRVAGRLVYSRQEIEEFMSAHPGACVLVPQLKEWASSHAATVRDVEELDTALDPALGPWLIQRSRTAAHRITVFTTPRRILWMCGAADLVEQLSPEMTRQIADIAAQACRAVPELRWIAVNVSLGRGRRDLEHPLTALVEGLTFNPRLSRDAVTLAGSLEDVTEMIIRGRGATPKTG